jgi:hypothetical protein
MSTLLKGVTMLRREFLIFASLFAAGCASKPASQPESPGLRFSESERQTITEYYARLRGPRPATPPAQGVKPGDTLLSGQRPNKLPVDLLKQLPDLRDPHTRLIVGADVVLINRDTHAILDVIPRVAY